MVDYENYYKSVSKLYNQIRLDNIEDFNNTISIIRQWAVNEGSILDIGCGTGKYGEALQALNYKVKGVDKSFAQIEEAKKIIDAQVAVSNHLPFESEIFDVCLMIMMIHQLDAKTRIESFKEIYRVLKYEGLLIIKTASHEDIKERFSSKYFPSAYKEDIYRYPTIDSLVSELNNEFDLQIIHTKINCSIDKEKFAQKIRQRRTSNLRNVSELELKAGISRFLNDYRGVSIINKANFNTFIIAKKVQV